MFAAKHTVLQYMRLTRLPLVVTAISNAWLIAFITHSEHAQSAIGRLPSEAQSLLASPIAAEHSLAVILMLLVGTAGGLYIFGMVLNDVCDWRKDRTFAPDRPLVRGWISMTHALALSLVALLVAIGCSLAMGIDHAIIALLTASIIVFYNVIGKFFPAMGLISLCLIRGGNMLLVEPQMVFYWPIWLTMTHVLALSGLCYRLEGKRPRMAERDLWIISIAWALWSLVMVAWMTHLEPQFAMQHPWLWVGPIMAAVAFLILVQVRLRWRHDELRHAGRAIMRIGLLWLIVYDAMWMVSAGMWQAAAGHGALLLVGLGMIYLMRNMQSDNAAPVIHPLSYRRD